MNKPTRIACLQMNSSASVEHNLAFIEEQLELASAQNVQLVQLPENFAQMPAKSADQYIEVGDQGRVQLFLRAQAIKHQLTIIAGSLPIKDEGMQKPFARSLVIAPNGKQIGSYDKIHLYDVDLADGQRYRESASYAAGLAKFNSAGEPELSIVESSVAKLGLSICYDLRFPELYRCLTIAGAELITVPSAFTFHTGQAHWEILLRARAIENQTYIMAAAQVGTHANKRETWGHSMIVDPWGEVVGELETSTGLVIADIDLSSLYELRKSFPVLSHCKL